MKNLPHDPVVIGAVRSPIGKHGGMLASVRPDDMLAKVMRAVIRQSAINVYDVDEVIAGCANQAGEDNRNVARMSSLLAGLPDKIAAITVNRLCASGLDAVVDGSRRIITGEANLVICGGVESMSRAPYVMAKSPLPFRLGAPEVFDSSLGWRFFNDKMCERTPPEHNGVTAERLVEQFKISRTRQDQFALRSHQNAVAAQINGFFEQEIVPFEISQKRETIVVAKDEGPRSDTSLAQLAALKSAFVDDGTVTAGNSSTLNDGAACLVIASHEYAKAHGHTVLARICAFASAGVDPRVMGLGPVPATEKILRQNNLSVGDFAAIEINEAFAAQVLAVIDSLKLDENKINTCGGAIALGHPLGCSGARIIVTLLNRLRHSQSALGLASLCVGVGQGVSVVVEAL